MKKQFFTSTKKQKEIKITVITCFVLAFLSLFISYSVLSLLDKDSSPINENIPSISGENISVLQEENIDNFVLIEAEKEITNLIKTYIDCSVKNEQEILYALSTNEWSENLKEKFKNLNSDNSSLKFITTSLTLTRNSLSNNEGFYTVSYIIETEQGNIQQNNEFFVIKVEENWKISKVS